MQARNLQYAQLLNCTDLSSPLACMRNATAQQLVDAATSLANNFTLNGTRFVDRGASWASLTLAASTLAPLAASASLLTASRSSTRSRASGSVAFSPRSRRSRPVRGPAWSPC